MPPRRGLRSGGPPPVIPPVQPNVPVSQPQAPIEEQQQQEAPIVAAPAVLRCGGSHSKCSSRTCRESNCGIKPGYFQVLQVYFHAFIIT